MSTCARCGAKLAPRASACGACGTQQIAGGDRSGQPQYGMLDLGDSPDLEAGPSLALDTGDEPPARVRGARGSAATQRRTAQGQRGQNGPAVQPQPARSGTLGASAANKANPAARSAATLAAGGAQPARAQPTVRTASANATLAGRPSTTSRSGAMRAVMPGANPAPQADSASYGRGMMLDDDPFNATFGSAGAAPASALELDEGTAAENEDDAPPPAAVQAAMAPEQQRGDAIKELAQYGPAPSRLLEQPAYWFRVMNRRRVLSEQLAALSAARKRADDQAHEVLAKLAEALYALRDEPELAGLAKQMAAVEDAQDRMGHATAQGERKRDDVTSELARLAQELKREEKHAAPLRQREAEIVARVEELKQAARRADGLRRKADVELEAMRSKSGADPERWQALVAERDARLGEFQTLGIEARPLEDDLSEVRRELAARTRKIASIQEEKRGAAGALERAQQNQRASVGSAKGARLHALLSLANAALKLGLHELLPEYATAVAEAGERVEKKRQQEELQRAAVHSYDAEAYKRGFTLLLGGSVVLFVGLILAVFV